MRKIVFVLLVLANLFFVPAQVSMAQTPPSPGQRWVEYYNPKTKNIELWFYDHLGTRVLMKFNQYGPIGTTHSSELPKKVWISSGAAQKKYFVITTADTSAPVVTDFAVMDSYFPSGGVPRLPKITITFNIVRNGWLNGGTASDKFEGNKISAGFDLTSYDPSQAATMTVLLNNTANGVRLFSTQRNSSPPKSQNIEACKSKGRDKPVFSDTTAAEEFMQEVKSKLLEDPANADDSSVINEFFNNATDQSEVMAAIKSKDSEMYRKFYGEVGKGYPTVALTDNLTQELINIYTTNEFIKPFAIEEKQPILRKIVTGAATIVGAGTGNPWIAAGAGVAAALSYEKVLSLIGGHLDRGSLKRMIPQVVELWSASGYISANNNYNQCLAGKGDPYALTNESLVQIAESLAMSSTDIGSGTATGTSSECDKISEGSSFMLLVKKGICAMLEVMKDWADAFMLWAIGWMKASMGVSDSTKDMETPDLEPGTGDVLSGGTGGTTGGGSSGGSTGGTSTPSTPITLSNAGTVQIPSAEVAKIKTEAEKSSGVISARIFKTDGAGNVDTSNGMTAQIKIVNPGQPQTKVEVQAQNALSYTNSLLMFTADGKNYKIPILKTGTDFKFNPAKISTMSGAIPELPSSASDTTTDPQNGTQSESKTDTEYGFRVVGWVVPDSDIDIINYYNRFNVLRGLYNSNKGKITVQYGSTSDVPYKGAISVYAWESSTYKFKFKVIGKTALNGPINKAYIKIGDGKNLLFYIAPLGTDVNGTNYSRKYKSK